MRVDRSIDLCPFKEIISWWFVLMAIVITDESKVLNNKDNRTHLRHKKRVPTVDAPTVLLSFDTFLSFWAFNSKSKRNHETNHKLVRYRPCASLVKVWQKSRFQSAVVSSDEWRCPCPFLIEQIKPQHIVGQDSMDNDEEPCKGRNSSILLCRRRDTATRD